MHSIAKDCGQTWTSGLTTGSAVPRPPGQASAPKEPATGYWQSHHAQMKLHATCLFPDPSEPQLWQAESCPLLHGTLSSAGFQFLLLLCLKCHFSFMLPYRLPVQRDTYMPLDTSVGIMILLIHKSTLFWRLCTQKQFILHQPHLCSPNSHPSWRRSVLVFNCPYHPSDLPNVHPYGACLLLRAL